MANSEGAPHLIDEISSANPPPGAVAIWWLGQASFALKAAGVVIYIDPYLQASDRRLSPPAFAPSAVTNADIVLLTHNHGDHVDPAALPGISAASPSATFVAPRPIAGYVVDLVGDSGRVVSAVADEAIEMRLGTTRLEILPVPAKHEEFDLTADGYPHLGYSVRIDGVCLHHSGDTIPYEGQIERVKSHGVNVALVPINGRDFYRTRAGTIGNFDYREAAEFAAQIGAAVVIPMHYGMFRGNTAPPGHLVSHAHEFHPELSIHVMGQFSKFVYVGE